MGLSFQELKATMESKGGGTLLVTSYRDLNTLLDNLGSARTPTLPPDTGGNLSGVTCDTHDGTKFPYTLGKLSFGAINDYQESYLTTCTCDTQTDTSCYCVARTTCNCVSRTLCSCVSRSACSCDHRAQTCDLNGCSCDYRTCNHCSCNSRTCNHCSCNSRTCNHCNCNGRCACNAQQEYT